MEMQAQELTPQQGRSSVQIPPLAQASVLVAGYDPRDGSLRCLNLGTLVEPLVMAEKVYCQDKLDSRNARKTATITAGTEVGGSVSETITVPSGEVWFVNRAVLTSPADSGAGEVVTVNWSVSSWPESKSYWPNARGTVAADEYTVDLPAQGELGEELRLVGGDVVTLTAALTTAAAGADLSATLTLYGRKGRRLIS